MYYKILNNDILQGFITLQDFRFYHPRRKRMFVTTEFKKAQYVIFQGQYYSVDWLAEAPELKGQYPKIQVSSATVEEYDDFIEKQKSEQK